MVRKSNKQASDLFHNIMKASVSEPIKEMKTKEIIEVDGVEYSVEYDENSATFTGADIHREGKLILKHNPDSIEGTHTVRQLPNGNFRHQSIYTLVAILEAKMRAIYNANK